MRLAQFKISICMATRVIFISYSWDNEAHKEWVLTLANNFVDNGIDVLLDQYDLSAGKEMTHFMEKAMTADKVLMILTPNYKIKADKREGGVGYEYSMLTKDFYDNTPDKARIIPVLKTGDEKTSCPTFVQTKVFHDMRDQNKYDAKLFELIKLIVDRPLVKKPPLGQLPSFEENEIPDLDKTIIDFRKKENFIKQKTQIIESGQGVKLFNAIVEDIVKNISQSLENYRKNFGLHFHIKVSNQPHSITFTTVNFTFHFGSEIKFSNSASEAYVKMNMFKGPVGFNELAFDYWEQPQKVYSNKYNFDLDENLNPIFVKADAPSIKLTAFDIASASVRDLITSEIKFQEGRLK